MTYFSHHKLGYHLLKIQLISWLESSRWAKLHSAPHQRPLAASASILAYHRQKYPQNSKSVWISYSGWVMGPQRGPDVSSFSLKFYGDCVLIAGEMSSSKSISLITTPTKDVLFLWR